MLFFKQSSCFSDSLRISLIIYYLLLLMCPIVNLWLHCNSCYIPQFTTYLPKSCLPLTSWAHYLLTRLLAIVSLKIPNFYQSVSQFSSVAQFCPTLCDPMNRSTPGLPVHHQLPEFTQTHVHVVSDAIQSSHPMSSSSPPAPNPSQHQSPFQWVNSSHEWGGQSTGVSALASFLPKKSQGWPPSEWTGCISLQSKGLSRVFSNTTVQKHQFFGAQPSSQSNSHIHTWPQEKP